MKLSPRTYTPADWLKIKPYTKFSACDSFYVQRCRDMYELLLEYEEWFAVVDVKRENLIELAGMLGSYFEDFTNEIGIWGAFVRHNQSIYNYPIPFYDLSDYDTDYINEADLAFIIWKYITNHHPDRNWAPDHQYILKMATEAFDQLEEAIDSAPVTTFYESYFTIRATDNFFVLKEKMHWFGLSSYLMGPELNPKLKEAIRETLEKLSPEQYEPTIYMLSEPFTFSHHTSFSGLCPATWFAEVARCSPDVKEAIRQTQYGHVGNYVLDGDTDKTYYHVRNCQTNRPYRVRRDSLLGGKPLPADTFNEKKVLLMNLRQWQNDWWLSGTLAIVPTTEAELNAYRNAPVKNVLAYDDTKLAKIRETEANYEQAFLTFFGSRLVHFRDEPEYEATIQQFIEYSNHLYANPDETPSDKGPMPLGNQQYKPEKDVPGPKKRQDAKGVSMFYRKGEGTLIAYDLKADVVDVLTAPNPTKKQLNSVFELIAIQMNPNLARYLLDTYGTRNFRYPIDGSRVDALREVEFFWRFYTPEESGPVLPLITIV